MHREKYNILVPGAGGASTFLIAKVVFSAKPMVVSSAMAFCPSSLFSWICLICDLIASRASRRSFNSSGDSFLYDVSAPGRTAYNTLFPVLFVSFFQTFIICCNVLDLLKDGRVRLDYLPAICTTLRHFISLFDHLRDRFSSEKCLHLLPP